MKNRITEIRGPVQSLQVTKKPTRFYKMKAWLGKSAPKECYLHILDGKNLIMPPIRFGREREDGMLMTLEIDFLSGGTGMGIYLKNGLTVRLSLDDYKFEPGGEHLFFDATYVEQNSK